ncbi:MAG: DUF1488 domain-containing protein [Rhizobiaceae bacterium]|nr:DUF1488 domain-containing protein [Rhizobiaceae bacterium]MCV0405505.1 DUF1488 domain-containing protein [Rhizobiaceae bacterium]
MTLTFPNSSRSYDEERGGVRFTGYDGMFEVPFLVEAEALGQGSGAISEAGLLSAFDAARSSIHDVAKERYSGGRRTRYILTAADFR